jgi:hypothetical protein
VTLPQPVDGLRAADRVAGPLLAAQAGSSDDEIVSTFAPHPAAGASERVVADSAAAVGRLAVTIATALKATGRIRSSSREVTLKDTTAVE